MMTDASCDWVLAVPGTAATGGVIDLYEGSPTSVTSGPMAIAVTNAVAAVLVGFWMNNSAMFLFTDTQGNLYSNVGTTANVGTIDGGSVQSAAAIVDLENNIHLYPIDPAGGLSVLHQVGWNTASGPTWAPQIPLDGGFAAVFADSSSTTATSIFAIDEEGAIWYSTQDLSTGIWSTTKAQMPGGVQSYNVSQYRTKVRVVDGNGNPPLGPLAIEVRSSTTSGVLVQGLWYPTSPTQAATITTDATGCATLSTIALGASTPALTLTATGLTTPAPINPAAPVQSYLGGTGTLNSGTSTERPTFGADTLSSATVGGEPLAPAAAQNPNVASAAAQGIVHMFTVGQAGNSRLTAVDGSSGFVLDLTDMSNPSFTILESHQDVLDIENGLVAVGSIDSWWDEVKAFFQDVWAGIKNAAIAVTKWVVNTVDSTISLVVQIGNEIHNIVGQLVSGIEQVADIVQSIFAAIGAEIENIVNWLKMMFDWGDIWDTKLALSSAISGAFPYLADQITWFKGQVVDKFFSNLEDEVTNSFNTVSQRFSQGQTLSGFLTTGAAAGVGASVGGTLLSDIESIVSSVQHNWLVEKIESYWGAGPAIQAVSALIQPMEDLGKAITNSADDFLKACDDFWNSFKVALSDPSQFSTLGVADFLNGVKELALAVLTFLDGIIGALLDVLAAAVASAGNILSIPFEIPLVSSIFDVIAAALGITIPTITVADLFALGLAIPVTLVYKLKNGASSEPFPGGTLPTGQVVAAASTAGDSPAADGCKYAAVAVTALWALFDTGLDAIPSGDAPNALGVIDIVAPTLIGVVTWPGGIPFRTVTLDTKEQKANFANWIVGWSVVGVDIAVMAVTGVSWAEGSILARYNDPAGKILLSAIGAINLTSGIVASSYGAGGGSIAANILGPVPVLLQFLRLDSLVEGSVGITLAVKLVADFFAGEGTAVAIAAT
jgi:hypothetical protein